MVAAPEPFEHLALPRIIIGRGCLTGAVQAGTAKGDVVLVFLTPRSGWLVLMLNPPYSPYTPKGVEVRSPRGRPYRPIVLADTVVTYE